MLKRGEQDRQLADGQHTEHHAQRELVWSSRVAQGVVNGLVHAVLSVQ